jgi:hypothetical protein
MNHPSTPSHGFVASNWSRIIGTLGRVFRIYVWEISVREILPQPDFKADSDLIPRLMTNDDLLRHARSSEHFDADTVQERFSMGDQCLDIIARGKLVAYSWRARTPVETIDGLKLALVRSDSVFGYKSWVDPEFRGRRLFRQMRLAFDPISKQNGTIHVIAYINLSNHSSRKSMRQDSSARTKGWLVQGKVGNVQWSFVTPAARQWVTTR